MTYKELYLKEHPECEDIDGVMIYHCPWNADGTKVYCPFDCLSGDDEDRCIRCWDKEIPETCSCYDFETARCNGTRERDKCMCGGIEANCDFYPEKRTKAAEKSDIQKTIEEIREATIYKKDTITRDEIPDPFDVSSVKIGDPDELKNIENDEKVKALETANNIDDAVNKVIIDPKLSLNENCKRLQLNWYNAIGVAGETAKKASETLAKTTSAILDSGSRREFSTGAVRDIQEGKGRCDLMPLDVIAEYLGSEDDTVDWVLMNIHNFQVHGQEHYLFTALCTFVNDSDVAWEADYTMFLEVAKHFEAGAKKYSEDNWKKGIPVRCYIDSAVRHYLKFLRGDKDEPHDRAFVWNILCCIWTCKHKPELNDYPRKEKTDE